MGAFLDDTIDLLRRTPGLLDGLLRGLPDAWTGTADTVGGWRPRDVVGHLISAELDDWIPRVHLILEAGDPKPFLPFDRFAHEERDRDVPLDALLDRFIELRSAGLADLEASITAADLDRIGLHPALGPVTLRQLLATWAVHDLDHISQVFAGLAGSHDADVGAWKAYLGILLRRDAPSVSAG